LPASWVASTKPEARIARRQYNARPLCAEVVLEQGSWRVSREGGTYDDLIRNDRT
jgi:hypothetical protein